jgi:hypothetical protein
VTIGIPYVSIKFTDKKQPYVICLKCKRTIWLTIRKDWESWSIDEYATHYQECSK